MKNHVRRIWFRKVGGEISRSFSRSSGKQQGFPALIERMTSPAVLELDQRGADESQTR
jgi:hypothetical protein